MPIRNEFEVIVHNVISNACPSRLYTSVLTSTRLEMHVALVETEVHKFVLTRQGTSLEEVKHR